MSAILFLPLLLAQAQPAGDTSLQGCVDVRDSLLILADEFFRDEKYDEAVEILTELKQWPDTLAVRDMLSCCVLYKLALTYYRLERYQEAEAEIRDWIKVYNDSAYAPPYYYLLGQCYEELNAYGDALDAYSYIMDHHPGHPVSGKAAKRIIFIYLMAGEVNRVASKVEETKSLMTLYPEIYKDAYGYGLLMLFGYYHVILDDSSEVGSEAKRLRSEISRFPEFPIEIWREVVADLQQIYPDREVSDSFIFYFLGLYEEFGQYKQAATLLSELDSWAEYEAVPATYRKLIELHLLAGNLEQAEVVVEELKEQFDENPEDEGIRDVYGYGLAALFDYYANVEGDEVTAEIYAKRLTDELGTTESIGISRERNYYIRGMKCTSTDSIPALRGYIEEVRSLNSNSGYLPEMMFNLVYLLFQDEQYEEAEMVLFDIRNWSDKDTVHNMIPDVSYQLARVYFEQERYRDAVNESLWWIGRYEVGDDARPDLAPYIYWWLGWSYYQLGEKGDNNPDRIEFYRNARVSFRVLKQTYGKSEFVQSTAEVIDQMIDQCEEKMGE